MPEPFVGQRAFSRSKPGNVMFSYELACRVDDTSVTATVGHPVVHQLRRRRLGGAFAVMIAWRAC